MSNISDAFDIILSELQAEFPTKTIIPNPYALEINNMQLLKNGFGLRVNEASKINLSYCRISNQRSMTIIFTRELIRLEADYVNFNNAVKLILEDIVDTQFRIFSDQTNLSLPNGVTKIDLTDQSGIQFVLTENSSFIYMELNFIIVTEENYNA